VNEWVARIEAIIGRKVVDFVFGDGFGHGCRLDRSVVGERLERGDGDVMPVHLEEFSELHAIVAAAKPVRAEHDVSTEAAARTNGAPSRLAPRNLPAAGLVRVLVLQEPEPGRPC
jgi:hypothetical protein